MALVHYNLSLIRDLLDGMAGDAGRLGRVATLSHPDVVVAPATLQALLGPRAAELPLRRDAVGIIGWHKAQSLTDRIPETPAVFRLLGYEMDAFDVHEGRGGELLHDLCDPLPGRYRHKYDLVFDCISNQVFNVAGCLANVMMLVRPGGYVVHTIPVARVNQGFYSVGPTFFHDFYRVNPFDVVLHRLVVGINVQRDEIALPDPTLRLGGIPEDTFNLVAARRRQGDGGSCVFPLLSKFLRSPTCHRYD